ncbi:UNVERIFIED_CONTAM: hypothetical protein K2H54_040053 [Gekko kuhli]
MEDSTELQPLVATWLAKTFNSDEEILPIIEAPYRLGPVWKQQRPFPREILVRSANSQIRAKILSTVHSTGSLIFQDHKVQILQDLSSETLQRRKAQGLFHDPRGSSPFRHHHPGLVVPWETQGTFPKPPFKLSNTGMIDPGRE